MAAEEPDSTIDDPEEISQTKRIKEILERRKEVLHTRDEAKQRALFGELGEDDALLLYRSEIESLIHELWNVFRNLKTDEDEDIGLDYLTEEEIATFQVDPPKSLKSEIDEIAVEEAWPQPKQFTIEGLNWLVEAPETITVEFTVRSFSPPTELTETKEYVLQWAELDAALRTALEFIDVAGIDANLAEKEQRTKIDRNLLEEVDKWRKENIDQ